MSCPDLKGAIEAEEHEHDEQWLISRGCKNRDPDVKQWVLISSGGFYHGQVIPLERYIQFLNERRANSGVRGAASSGGAIVLTKAEMPVPTSGHEPGVVNSTVYAGGRKVADVAIEEAGEWSKRPGHVVWIGLVEQ